MTVFVTAWICLWMCVGTAMVPKTTSVIPAFPLCIAIQLRSPSIHKQFQSFPPCPQSLASTSFDLSPRAPIFLARHPSHLLPHHQQPYVALAVVFNHTRDTTSVPTKTLVGPTYKIAMPIHYAERFIRQTLPALLFKTAGVWALDIMIDFTLDGSLGLVLQSILDYLGQCHSKHGHSFHHQHKGKHQRNSSHQFKESEQSQRRDHCLTYSYPTLIRVVLSDGYPLFETRAENIAFSTEERAEWYISVQADMMVLATGWNELLIIPAVIRDDVFSVSGHCAHNLKNMETSGSAAVNSTATSGAASNTSDVSAMPEATTHSSSLYNGWHNVGHCMSNELHQPLTHAHAENTQLNSTHQAHFDDHTQCGNRFSFHNQTGDELRYFHIRDTSNRGPLVMRGHMMRDLGFFDELNWLNGNDDHDIHTRAFVHGRWRTGYFELPFEHVNRDKELELKLKNSYLNGQDGDNNSSSRNHNKIQKEIIPHQQHLRKKRKFSSHYVHLPIREEMRTMTDDELCVARETVEKYTRDRISFPD